MQRNSQYSWIKEFVSFLFSSSQKVDEISNEIRRIADETYNTHFETEIFDINKEVRNEDKTIEKLDEIEFLQDLVEKYLQKRKYQNLDNENEYIGIALIYELCIKILYIIKIKINDEVKQELNEEINKWLIYNTTLCCIYYICGKEIWMSQIIWQQILNIIEFNWEYSYKLMTELIKLFSYEERKKIGKKDILAGLADYITAGSNNNIEDIKGIYLNILWPSVNFLYEAIEILKKHSLRWYYQKLSNADWKFNSFMWKVFTGIRFLLPWQKDVLEKLDEYNTQEINSNIITMPTSAGKSLIAEIEIAKNIYKNPKQKIIYIAPKVALCKQIKEDLEFKFWIDISDEISDKIIIWFSDEEAFDLINAKNNIIIMTPERFLLSIGRDPNLLDSISMLVFDEFHNIWLWDRWSKMELLLNLIKYKKKEKELDLSILLLSALAKNVNDIKNRLYDYNWNVWGISSLISPTRKQILCQNSKTLFHIKDLYNWEASIKKTNIDIKINFEEKWFPKIKKKEKILIFVPTKPWIWAKLKKMNNWILKWRLLLETTQENQKNLDNFAKSFSKNEEINAIKNWIGFYYKGINERQANEILRLYKKNILKIVVGNTTITEWVNLDIEYLIFWYPFVFENNRISPFKLMDLINLIGRAGRFPKQSDWFVFINILDSKWKKSNHATDIINNLINSKNERGCDIESQLIKIDNLDNEIDVFLMSWLSDKSIEEIDGSTSSTSSTISKLEEDFISYIANFFVGYNPNSDNQTIKNILEKKIKKIQKHFDLSKNFLTYQKNRINPFFRATGMSNMNSELLLNIYNKIKREWYKIEETSSLNFEDIFSEDIIWCRCENFEITTNIYEKVKNNAENSENEKYYLSRIFWCLLRQAKQDGISTDICNLIELTILKIKYWIESKEAFDLLRKNPFLSPKLANDLIRNNLWINKDSPIDHIELVLEMSKKTVLKEHINHINYILQYRNKTS